MHGIGNDYIYINCFEFDINGIELNDLARKISHRHFGIGGDGLVLIMPGIKEPIKMRIFNSDGSEAEMCGNAIRCVAGYCYNHGIIKIKNFGIEALAGRIGIEILDKQLIKVDMGKPILKPRDIPVDVKDPKKLDEPLIEYPIKIEDFDGKFTAVSMGNPHAVYFLQDIDNLNLEKIGPKLEHHIFFPKRINSEFIEIISPNEVKCRVWERGAGETWACGTGACASLVAGNLTKKLNNRVLFHLKGGDLIIETTPELDRVFKIGPYEEVGEGIYYYKRS